MVIRNWVFDTFLGVSLSEYLTRKMETADHPNYFTVNSIKYLITLNTFDSEKYFTMASVPIEWRADLEAMWSSFLQKELPLLCLSDQKTDETLLNSPEFSQLYTGTRFLSDVSQLRNFSSEESIHLGEALWRIALHEGVSADKAPYFLLPDLFFTAARKPKSINKEINLHSISAAVIDSYIENTINSEITRQRLITQLERYQSAVNQWLSKGQLADKIIADCPSWELPSLYDMADAIRTPKKKREKAQRQSRQLYMNCITKPCRTAPDSLGDEYQRLTKNVADCFSEVDKHLIGSALENLESSDADFIFSRKATVYPVFFSMKTQNALIVAYNYAHDNNRYIYLKKTDIFSVIIDDQERIYALKWEEKDEINRYLILRLDRDIQHYIDADVLDHQDIGNNGVVDGKKFKTDKYVFHVTISVDKKNPLTHNGDKDKIIDYLSSIHRENLYQSLYSAGNDSSEMQTLWKIASRVIPFYDCI
ncbi:MAG: hypothetical protein ACMZI0_06580 [Symbiopectobacterium sp.]|uniref:hypothetical protein n=1 Tax=Symbiopectobacterium sp. TaxID=2952789 RepID=UPI0039E97BD1